MGRNRTGTPVLSEGLNGQFLGTLAGRVGFAADGFFFYLSGGGAVLTAEATADTPDETDNLTFFGWTIGAGAEFAVTEDVSLRADYRYYSFGQEVASFTPVATTTWASIPASTPSASA